MGEVVILQTGRVSRTRETAKQLLLFCGILGALVYIGADIVAAARWDAYSYSGQMVSELMAVDAPTRPFLVRYFTAHNLLILAFGIGVLVSTGLNRSLRVAGILLMVYAIVGQAALLFAPMHMRGTSVSAIDQWHKALTAVIVVVTLLFIGFGSRTGGRAFRLYSFTTILVLLVCGGLASLQAPRVEANLPTPGFGILERVNIYGSLLWMAALAAVRLRAVGAASRRPLSGL